MAATVLRDVPPDIMDHSTRKAAQQVVSRNALLVRVLTACARREHQAPRTVADLQESAERTKDLRDPAVMGDAWA